MWKGLDMQTQEDSHELEPILLLESRKEARTGIFMEKVNFWGLFSIPTSRVLAEEKERHRQGPQGLANGAFWTFRAGNEFGLEDFLERLKYVVESTLLHWVCLELIQQPWSGKTPDPEIPWVHGRGGPAAGQTGWISMGVEFQHINLAFLL